MPVSPSLGPAHPCRVPVSGCCKVRHCTAVPLTLGAQTMRTQQHLVLIQTVLLERLCSSAASPPGTWSACDKPSPGWRLRVTPHREGACKVQGPLLCLGSLPSPPRAEVQASVSPVPIFLRVTDIAAVCSPCGCGFEGPVSFLAPGSQRPHTAFAVCPLSSEPATGNLPLCSPGWLPVHNLPASAFRVLQVCTSTRDH